MFIVCIIGPTEFPLKMLRFSSQKKYTLLPNSKFLFLFVLGETEEDQRRFIR